MIYSCKDCKERTLGCHSTCEKYIEEHKENLRNRKLRNKKQNTLSTLYAPIYSRAYDKGD